MNDLGINVEFCGQKPDAWAAGDALAEKDKLEDFIRAVAHGQVPDPACAAQQLMDEMKWS